MNWYKRAQWESKRLQGEWWFIDGEAHYADVDIGDVSHEAMAVQWAIARIRDTLVRALDDEGDRVQELRSETDKIIREMERDYEFDLRYKLDRIEDEFPESYARIMNELVSAHGKDTVEVAFGKGYPIGWGLSQGWVRCKGNWLEMGKITSDTLRTAATGIGNAWGEGVSDETEFNIEVSPQKGEGRGASFNGVPLSIIERRNPSLLLKYKARIY